MVMKKKAIKSIIISMLLLYTTQQHSKNKDVRKILTILLDSLRKHNGSKLPPIKNGKRREDLIEDIKKERGKKESQIRKKILKKRKK
jgi:hypothetical protein